MVRIEADLSRYCIGKGREQQVDLLSDDDFYSQEDYEELEKIEKWIRNLFLVHEKVPFINIDQILDLYYKTYCSEFDWDNFARSSDTTLSEFILETWPQSFKIVTCPNNNSEWISLTNSTIIKDESFDAFLSTKKTKSNGHDKGLYDIGFVPNRTILYPCCLELLYKELYKEIVDIKSTEYHSFSELMYNSIIWKPLGKDKFIAVKSENQKYDISLSKKEEPKLNDLQFGVISIISGKYYGD
ncbi:22872_t:CDS:2 [Rhizophagus irregularis]|nr:22872_t:CDS:2 [Rhizophagus irregularis]